MIAGHHLNTLTMRSIICRQGALLILILVFAYAATSKLLDLPAFRYQLAESPSLQEWARPLSWILPLIELATAGLMLFTWTKRAGLFCSALMLTIFTLYLSIMLAGHRRLPCSCGGLIASLSWKTHILFNLGLILLTGLAWQADAPEAAG